MRLKGFDLETTGVDTATAKIWQVATNEKEWLVNPGVPIPEDVRKLCRIDDALLARIEEAPKWAEVQDEVLAHLNEADALVTLNGIKYDEKVIRAHIGDSIKLPPVIDVRILATEFIPDICDHECGETTFSGYKLANLAIETGLLSAEALIEGSHNAVFDCWVTLGVFNRLPCHVGPLDRILAFQRQAQVMQDRDWERFGVAPAEGPAFLWFRSCRACRQVFSGRKLAFCERCGGWGILHQTKKRRGQRVDAGFLRWLRGLENCPAALKRA